PGQKNPIDSNTIRSSSLRDYTTRSYRSIVDFSRATPPICSSVSFRQGQPASCVSRGIARLRASAPRAIGGPVRSTRGCEIQKNPGNRGKGSGVNVSNGSSQSARKNTASVSAELIANSTTSSLSRAQVVAISGPRGDADLCERDT